MLNHFRASWNSQFARPLPEGVKDALSEQVFYYQSLDVRNRKRFEARLYALLPEMNFVPEDLPEVTPEMVALLGGGIIQLTFGLKHFIFTEMNRVHIVPRPYAYRGKTELMVGDMNLETKRVSFSWPDVIKGFDVEDDARNVVLHEFTHCLDYEDSKRSFGKFFHPRIKRSWQQEAHKEMERIQGTKDHIVRKYGATNIREMFSVTVEHFFERPQELKAVLPKLYRLTAILLNQNPINPESPILKK